MRIHLLTLASLCSCALLITAIPLPANEELDVLQIPISEGKELDVLTLSAQDQEQLIAERNKRTIGLLRELFPEITQQVDSFVNRIIAQVIRTVGPQVFRSFLTQNRQTTAKPKLDFDNDDDDNDDFDDDDDDDDNSKDSVKKNTENARVELDLPVFSPDSDESTTTSVTKPTVKR